MLSILQGSYKHLLDKETAAFPNGPDATKMELLFKMESGDVTVEPGYWSECWTDTDATAFATAQIRASEAGVSNCANAFIEWSIRCRRLPPAGKRWVRRRRRPFSIASVVGSPGTCYGKHVLVLQWCLRGHARYPLLPKAVVCSSNGIQLGRELVVQL
jgi:hypothetical protein